MDISKLQKYYKSSTRGAWSYFDKDAYAPRNYRLLLGGTNEVLANFKNFEDLLFTVELRNVVPELLEEVEQLQGRIKLLTAMLKHAERGKPGMSFAKSGG